MIDYIILAVVAAVGCGGGLYILHEAKKLKAKRDHEQVKRHVE